MGSTAWVLHPAGEHVYLTKEGITPGTAICESSSETQLEAMLQCRGEQHIVAVAVHDDQDTH